MLSAVGRGGCELFLDVAGEPWRLGVPEPWMTHVRQLFRHLVIDAAVSPSVAVELTDGPCSASARAAAAAMRDYADPDASLAQRHADHVAHCSRMSYHAYRGAERRGELALLRGELASMLLGTNLLLRHFTWRAMQRGMVPLHAAAIGGGEGFWRLPAGAGSGKSVTTAVALSLGLEALGDDFVLWNPVDDTIHSLYCSVRLRPEGLELVRAHRPDFRWRTLGLRDDGKCILQPDADGFRTRGVLRGVLSWDEAGATGPARALKAFSSTALLLRSLGYPAAEAFAPLAALARRVTVRHLPPRAPLHDLGRELQALCR